MYRNVLRIFFLTICLTNFAENFRLFSSAEPTHKDVRPFFKSKRSLVEDFFSGDLVAPSNLINSQTFVFVMYYANFCGISRRMRDPFEKAAQFYLERFTVRNETIERFRVKFIAIDCFHHETGCRKTYKLNYFPQMFLYVKGLRAFQYFGSAVASNIINFVEKIRHPVFRIVKSDDLHDFIVENELCILAHFNISNPIEREYHSIFVQTALKHIEYDNEHPIRFALILNRTVAQELFHFASEEFSTPFVVRHRFESSIAFYPNLTMNNTIDNLFQWSLGEFVKPNVSWIVPKNRYFSRSPSSNKATFHEVLSNDENLLILLTPNKIDELKLRFLFISLYNCRFDRWKLSLERLKMLHSKRFQSKRNLSKPCETCCESILDRLSNEQLFEFCSSDDFSSKFKNLTAQQEFLCSEIVEQQPWQRNCSQSYCHRWLKSQTSIRDYSDESQRQIIFEERREKQFQAINDVPQQIQFSIDEIDEKFQGFLCNSNSTWNFRLIDTIQYPNFVKNLGLNDSTAILLLQNNNENQYVLSQNEISAENLYKFIDEISKNIRPRSLISNSVKIFHENRSDRIVELTTETFHPWVINTKKHVLVVYYTKWCGFCRSIWPILLNVRKFFEKFDDLIFTRIEADKNDLPWHLTVFNYPTIVLFPGENKANSIVFPISNEPLTSATLIRFLLFYLYADRNVAPSSCQQTNNSFMTMLSSSYVDFAQLTSIVKSCT